MFGTGGIGGPSASDHIQSARDGVKGANQAVLDVMKELNEFLDAQDVAMKQEAEVKLREQLERLTAMLEKTGGLQGLNSASLDSLQKAVDEARMGGAGESPVIREAQQLIDDIRAQMGMLA